MAKTKRQGISKRTRFEVFKRDGMICRYCGNPPQVSPLVLDHVIPVSKGGTSEPENLVAACTDCNSGKSDVPLEERKFRAVQVDEAMREQAEQIREYLAIQKGIYEAKKDLIRPVIEKWSFTYGDPDQALKTSFGRAVSDFGLGRTLEAVDIVVGRDFSNWRQATKYLYGILRNWRQELETKPKPATSASGSELSDEAMEERYREVFYADEKAMLADQDQFYAGYRIMCVRSGKDGPFNIFQLQPKEDARYLDVRGYEFNPYGASIEFVIRGGELDLEAYRAMFEPALIRDPEIAGWYEPHPRVVEKIKQISKSNRNVGPTWSIRDEEG